MEQLDWVPYLRRVLVFAAKVGWNKFVFILLNLEVYSLLYLF